MYRDKNIVVVTPAGRQRYLQILLPYILRERNIIDEYRLWVNTTEPTDLEYIHYLTEQYPDFIQADYLDDPKPDWKGNRRVRLICNFFRNCISKNTIYVRIDDDICWMMPGAIQKLLDFRIDNEEFFLVYPGIFNNGYTAVQHSKLNLVNVPNDVFRRWQREPSYGKGHHEKLIEAIELDEIDKWAFDAVTISDYAQAPINCISWIGEAFAEFNGVVANAECDFLEEVWLTKIKPKEIGRYNCMYGKSLMAHFAFNTQRSDFESNTNLLEVYEILSLYDGAMP